MTIFVQGILSAAAGLVVSGMIVIIRTLFSMRRDVVGYSVTIQALAEVQPIMVQATRYQNAALREIGANGATEKSDKCLDEADKVLRELLVEKVKGGTK